MSQAFPLGRWTPSSPVAPAQACHEAWDNMLPEVDPDDCQPHRWLKVGRGRSICAWCKVVATWDPDPE